MFRLRLHNVSTAVFQALGGVAGVDHQGGVVADPLPVVGGVVGEDEDGVRAPQELFRELGGLEVETVFPHGLQPGDVRVVVGNLRPALQEKLHDGVGGGLPVVVDILLVGHAQGQDLRPVEALPPPVQRFHRPFDDVVGHGDVDLPRQLDEAGGKVVLLCLPGKVEGVDGDAVAPEPRSGIEGGEAEGFGCGRLDHLPDVDPHLLGEDLQFVHERDVHAAVDVLQELRELRHPRGGHGHHPGDRLLVERRRMLQARRRDPAHHLGDVAGVEGLVARVFPLGGEGQVKIPADLEARALEAREHEFLRGAGVGGGFEHHELPGTKVLGDRVGGGFHEAQVGLHLFGERRGHADDDAVGVGEAVEAGGDLQLAARQVVLDRAHRDVADVALAPLEGCDFARVDVEPDEREPGLAKAHEQRQADVAEADDAHRGLAGADFLQQGPGRVGSAFSLQGGGWVGSAFSQPGGLSGCCAMSGGLRCFHMYRWPFVVVYSNTIQEMVLCQVAGKMRRSDEGRNPKKH